MGVTVGVTVGSEEKYCGMVRATKMTIIARSK
jgi:hypothetical protein